MSQEQMDIKQSIEDEVADLVTIFTIDLPMQGRIDIFAPDYESNTFGGLRTLRLIPVLSKSLNQFSSTVRSQIVKALQGNTSDLNRLIGLAGGLRSEEARAEVEAQIKEALKNDPLRSEHWLTRIEQMALDSANYGLIETSKFVLNYGDQITVEHPYRQRWEELAFQIKLLIAYHEGNRAILEKIPLPNVDDKVKIAGKLSISQRLERRRQFLLAVLGPFCSWWHLLAAIKCIREAAVLRWTLLIWISPRSSSILRNKIFGYCIKVMISFDRVKLY